MDKSKNRSSKDKRSDKAKSPAKKNNFVCTTCGRVSKEEEHLCTPKVCKKTYVCEHCGTLTDDSKHMCKPKLKAIKFYCDFCGRVAEEKTALCNPVKL